MSDPPVVRAHIDASYGVHTDSGRSHTGCVVSVGSGPVFAKSAKQRIVTKSSTELVGLSDTASQAIHIREFLLEQGLATGQAMLGQDNLSAIALVRRGAPGSERSRHIAIRHFWLKERVDDVTVVHVPTADMVANVLTKPVQGNQFTRERDMLIGWKSPSQDFRGVLGHGVSKVDVQSRAGNKNDQFRTTVTVKPIRPRFGEAMDEDQGGQASVLSWPQSLLANVFQIKLQLSFVMVHL
eukprot:gene12319-8810_t